MLKNIYVPLWSRILLLATLNLSVLGGVLAIFMRMQLKPDFESFLMAEARERIASITRLITSELATTDMAQWSDVLDRYSKDSGITILLYRNTGEQLAGAPTRLPPEVDVRMPRGGPPPPPPRRSRGPGGLSEPRSNDPGPPMEGGPGPPPSRGRGSGGGPEQGNNPGPPFLAVTDSGPRYWVGVRMPIIGIEERESLRSVLMLVSPSFFTNPFFFNLRPWIAMGAGALLITAVCWLPLIRNLTRSIAAMKRATSRIADGRFDVSLRAVRRDEIGSLGAAINQMAGRLQALTEGRKRFLGDAAHELRSPIARMQLAAEILDRNADKAAQKYVDLLKEDLMVMAQLTDELLHFTKTETASQPTQLETVDLAGATWDAVRRESADGADMRVHIDASLTVQANKELLVRALANVLRNAARYAGDKGPIEVSAVRKGHDVQISISDAGPGIPDEALDKVFMPFYRLDHARDRRTGGTGLGLAIVRTCIEACGGAVECRNRQPSGLEVIIRLTAA
jgi:two-component system, OmpR family, sensor histidine kinase CpxA